MLENPYSLQAAAGKNFTGRTDILAAWRERLTLDTDPWNSAKSWMVIGADRASLSTVLA